MGTIFFLALSVDSTKVICIFFVVFLFFLDRATFSEPKQGGPRQNFLQRVILSISYSGSRCTCRQSYSFEQTNVSLSLKYCHPNSSASNSVCSSFWCSSFPLEQPRSLEELLACSFWSTRFQAGFGCYYNRYRCPVERFSSVSYITIQLNIMKSLEHTFHQERCIFSRT